MFTNKLNYVLFLFIFQGYDCQRRIQDGIKVTGEKRYVVYLLRAVALDSNDYTGWLCGGAIVTESYIVTSAACVNDVTHLYAIAGYKKYVKDEDIYTDSCTKQKKKKIVLICSPKDYTFEMNKRELWSFMDIAVVKVETPYDFTDTSYAGLCSYTPAKIEINYEQKYQEPGIDAIVLGWGHKYSYRKEKDTADYNSNDLLYSPTLVINKNDCKNSYTDYENMNVVIDKYMLCTDKKGNLNDIGGTILKQKPTAEGCDWPVEAERRLICKNANAADEQADLVSRKNRNPVNLTVNDASQNPYNINKKRNNSVVDENSALNSTLIKTINKTVIHSRRSFTRRNGICQNDHGGPLVTWVGAHEKLIGVASVFKLDEKEYCIGPYLFTSTQCSGAFLNCIITEDALNGRRNDESCANFTRETGLTIDEKHISWHDHPDGPAENEKNITTHALPANTDTNATKNIMNTTEEKNIKLEHNNTIKLVNTNITDTLENTKITKAPANTDTNATKNLMNSTEEKNIKLEHNNTIKLVNTNITDNLENTTITKAPANTDTNATKNLMNSTEEKNIKLEHNNTIKLVNTNTTDT